MLHDALLDVYYIYWTVTQLMFTNSISPHSVSVFGVSPRSMQCSFDKRGNSVPTILLNMQRKLYLLGGLQVKAKHNQEILEIHLSTWVLKISFLVLLG
jgi:hypothetical protein